MVLMFSSCLFSSYRIKTSVEDRHILNVSTFFLLILCLLMSSADNICKQFGPRSGATKCWAWSGSKLFDTLMLFLKEFFEKIDFEKCQQTTINQKTKSYIGCKLG